MTKRDVKFVTWALILANAISGLDATIITTALPAIISDLDGIQFMGWCVAIFLFGVSVSTPFWNKLGELFGTKKAFLGSLLIFAVTSVLEGLAPNIYLFIAARALMGIGAGGMGALPYIIIGYLYDDIYDRTKALGMVAASFSFASIIGPLLGGVIVDALSWHWIFYLNVPFSLITMYLTWRYYKTDVKKVAQKNFDWLGSVLMVAGLVIFLSGVQLLGLTKLSLVMALIILGLVILTLFVLVERKLAHPLIKMDIFKNKQLVVDFILFSLAWGSFVAYNTYAPIWSQGLLGTSALVGGAVLIPNSIADLFGSQSAAWIQRRFKIKTVLTMGLSSILITAALMAVLPFDTPLIVLMATGLFSGFGVGLVFVILQVKVQMDARKDEMSEATSLSYLIRILAQTLMAAIYGVLMNQQLAAGVHKYPQVTLKMLNNLTDAKNQKLLPQNLMPTLRSILHQGMVVIMVAAAVLALIAVVVNWRSKNTEIKHKGPLQG